MKNAESLEARIHEFSQIVQEEFRFLETEYRCSKPNLEEVDFTHFQDARVVITYLNNVIGIRIEWYLAVAKIGIGMIELGHGKIPEQYSYYGHKGYARAISLKTLVHVVAGQVQDPLPENYRAGKKRKKRIEQDMAGVLHTYATWLHEYAGDILQGETSIFPQIHQREKEEYEKEFGKPLF